MDAVTPVLIDTDPGIDDALALLFAWGSPELRPEVVTVVAGNVPLPFGITNVFRILALRRPELAPLVAAGAERPLARALRTTRYHGEDGLGDLDDWPAVDVKPAREDAAVVIAASARRWGERLTLIALGPLTNLALALEVDRQAMGRVGRVVVMGGAVDVPGNVTEHAEFNIYVDPEAAARVFAVGLPIELVPLDATRQAVLERERLEAALGHCPGPLAERIAAFTQRAFRLEEKGMILHDPLAVALAVDATLADWEAARLAIGPDGETRPTNGPPNCRRARRVDRSRFLTMFLERLCPRG